MYFKIKFNSLFSFYFLKLKYHLTLLSLFFVVFAYSQAVEIKSTVQKNQKIYITYDLNGKPGKYNIKIYVKANGSYYWSSPLKWVSGDVGENQKIGNNKQIIWDVLQDRDKFQGDYIFGINASRVKEDAQKIKKANKKIKKSLKLLPSSFLAYSCNFKHNPFGLSYFRFGRKKLIGTYIDVRTDFRVWAPGEFALRDRQWITGSMGGIDNGIDIKSNGGNNLTFGITFPLLRTIKSNLFLHSGLGVSSIPVFDEFFEPFTGPYYAKSFSDNKLNINIGVVRQSSGGFNWGFSYDTVSPGFNFIFGFSL